MRKTNPLRLWTSFPGTQGLGKRSFKPNAPNTYTTAPGVSDLSPMVVPVFIVKLAAMLKDPGHALRWSMRVGDIEDDDFSGIKFLGNGPVFLGGVERGLKRGISIWIMPGWNQVRVPVMAAAAA